MSLLERMHQAFSPEFFGDCDADTRDRRLKGYITEAQQKTATRPENAEAKDQAQEAWVQFRAYGDAFTYWLGKAASTSVEGEGSVNQGDVIARAKLMGAERDRWKAIFDGLLASPAQTRPRRNQPSGYLLEESVF